MQSARHLSQIADLRRKLSAQREDARRSEEQRVAMARNYLNQITEVAKESSLKDEELRKLREQYRRRGQIDQANNLQQRDRDWVINQNEVNVQIRRDQNLGEGAWGTVYRGKFRGCRGGSRIFFRRGCTRLFQ